MTKLTEQDIDQLALEAAEMIGFKSGSTVAYDVAGYTRCLREPLDPATLPTYDLAAAGLSRRPGQPVPREARFDAAPYPARLAGFRRRQLFGPDEIGARLRSLGIAFNDGLGNGLYESLRIDRKYGLNHVIEAPILGFQLPYVAADWPAFRQRYAEVICRWKADLEEMEAVYRGPLASAGTRLVVLWARHYPLDLFTQAYTRDPQAVSADLRLHTGLEIPPVRPQNSQERAALVKFWSYARRKLSEILVYQADAVRAALGPGARVAANPHELPVLDMAGQGRAYEYPSVAVRPLLLDDPVFLRHYSAYFTQFVHDLTGKPPMVSVRMNLSAATPRFVPTGDLIRVWYDQAVRHGAGAFYFWTRDYPPCDGAYDGPIPGNPVAATLPQERWESVLETLGRLSTHRRFQKPAAQVAILVPFASALLNREGWRRIYALFSAFAEASIHTRFLSDEQVEQGGLPGEVQMLVAPALEFISPRLRAELEAFAGRGGRLLAGPSPIFDREGHPAAPLAGSEPFDPTVLDLFPLDQPASLVDLQRLANRLADLVNRSGIDPQSWVFEITIDSLPPAESNFLRQPDPQVRFAPWQYEHGSEWIMPYLEAEGV
jgi:hypothetical protein